MTRTIPQVKKFASIDALRAHLDGLGVAIPTVDEPTGAAGPLGGTTTPQGELPNTNGLGKIQANSLELSNVDLANEFANLISTQRGFQASARIITVSDEILQELVNLKR